MNIHVSLVVMLRNSCALSRRRITSWAMWSFSLESERRELAQVLRAFAV
jgi:hypothetical protein